MADSVNCLVIIIAKDDNNIVKMTPSCGLKNIFTSAKEVMFLSDFVCLSVCLSVCQQDNSKSYGRIFLKF